MVIINISKLLSIKLKARHDSHSDQYNRIFMLKLFLVCSAICGISWYNDSINCHLPGYDPESAEFEVLSHFAKSTCWIQGFYVYRELHKRNDNVAYFGITTDVDMDGFLVGKDELCKTYDRLKGTMNNHCVPMTKTFYLQYQYMPFLLAVIGALYYVPYILFGAANSDLYKLEQQSTKKVKSAKSIHIGFFREKHIGTFKKSKFWRTTDLWHYVTVWMVKILYIFVNIGVLFLLDFVLGQTFIGFGERWWGWMHQNNTQQYDYMGSRLFPKPGNEVLPPFGYCELYTSAKDLQHNVANHYKVVCELSQHVLYQYTLIVLWFCIVLGVVVSIFGFLHEVYKFFEKLLGIRRWIEKDEVDRTVISHLNYREIEYLDYIHKHNICLYGELMELLRGNEVGSENTAQ